MSENASLSKEQLDFLRARITTLEITLASVINFLDHSHPRFAEDLIDLLNGQAEHAAGKDAPMCFAIEDMVEKIRLLYCDDDL